MGFSWIMGNGHAQQWDSRLSHQSFRLVDSLVAGPWSGHPLTEQGNPVLSALDCPTHDTLRGSNQAPLADN